MADTYLTRTPSSSSNRKTFTWSGWIKRSQLGATNTLFTSGYSSNAVASLKFLASDKLDVFDYNSSTQFAVITNRLFRDTSAWYHIVMRVDTTLATANDRVRLYVNGEQETSLDTNTQPSQNYDSLFNGGVDYYIGRYGWTNPDSFDGSMSHIHFCDGQSYAPTEFGETDTTTGQWKIKTSPSVTYGTNGFFILKNGNTITDQSGEGNNFTLGGGTLTNTLDCPSNVFATLNALAKPGTGNLPSFGNGNTHYNKTATGAGNNSMIVATLGATTGKFYYEYKMNDSNAFIAGISTLDNTYYDANGGSMNTASGVGVAYQSSGNKIINGTSTTYGNSYGSGNIVGVAFDLVNNVIYFSKDGVWQNSGDPTSGSSGTGGIGIATTGITYSPFAQNNGYNSPSSVYYNFGNGYFGTTAVASAGTPGSTPGTFEYDVPSGYQPLSTKGLNA